jgi:hypothetical protein
MYNFIVSDIAYSFATYNLVAKPLSIFLESTSGHQNGTDEGSVEKKSSTAAEGVLSSLGLVVGGAAIGQLSENRWEAFSIQSAAAGCWETHLSGSLYNIAQSVIGTAKTGRNLLQSADMLAKGVLSRITTAEPLKATVETLGKQHTSLKKELHAIDLQIETSSQEEGHADLLQQRNDLANRCDTLQKQAISIRSKQPPIIAPMLSLPLQGTLFGVQLAATAGWASSLLASPILEGKLPSLAELPIPAAPAIPTPLSDLLRSSASMLNGASSYIPHAYMGYTALKKGKELLIDRKGFGDVISDLPGHLVTIAAWELINADGLIRPLTDSAGLDSSGWTDTQLTQAALCIPLTVMTAGSMLTYGYHSIQEYRTTDEQTKTHHMQGRIASRKGLQAPLNTAVTNLFIFAGKHYVEKAAEGLLMGADATQYGIWTALASRTQKIPNLDTHLLQNDIQKLIREIQSATPTLSEESVKLIEKLESANSDFMKIEECKEQDLEELKKIYKNLQRVLHPDKLNNTIKKLVPPIGTDTNKPSAGLSAPFEKCKEKLTSSHQTQGVQLLGVAPEGLSCLIGQPCSLPDETAIARP